MTEIARTYGQALYDLAAEEGLAGELLEQITTLDQCFCQQPDFLALLCSPALSRQERCQVLESCLTARVHRYLLNFLRILTEKGYMRHFSGCCQLFRQ